MAKRDGHAGTDNRTAQHKTHVLHGMGKTYCGRKTTDAPWVALSLYEYVCEDCYDEFCKVCENAVRVHASQPNAGRINCNEPNW